MDDYEELYALVTAGAEYHYRRATAEGDVVASRLLGELLGYQRGIPRPG